MINFINITNDDKKYPLYRLKLLVYGAKKSKLKELLKVFSAEILTLGAYVIYSPMFPTTLIKLGESEINE